MSANTIELPSPEYHLGDFFQWSLPKEKLPETLTPIGLELFPRIHWKNREQSEGEWHWGHLAGFTFDEKMDLLEKAPHTILFHWQNFFDREGTGEWSKFFDHSLPILPQISLFPDKLVLRHVGKRLDRWPCGPWPSSPLFASSVPSLPSVLEEKLNPSYDGWKSKWSLLAKEFETQSLDKVVLSRKKIRSFRAPLDTRSLWKSKEFFQKDNYHISIEADAQTSFHSFTPECLFKLEGRLCQTEALAGSMGRGRKDDDLLKNLKELEEHEIVIEGIVEDMEHLSEGHHFGDIQVIQLGYIQHLKTPLSFTLKENVSPLDLCRILHPTPALGGRPKKKALEFIQNHGGFDPGLYGAPIGRLEKDVQEYAVGIRSALLTENEMHIFAGAGITATSNADSEWRETEEKMRPFS
ncbi:MAG: isochorismate synthase [Bacteriovoracales bacterium]|nr:isochorismate synthase [Bacteriovoracales bacterium]